MKNLNKPNPIYNYTGVGVYNHTKVESNIIVGKEESKNTFMVENALSSKVLENKEVEELKEYSITFEKEETSDDSPNLTFQTEYNQNGDKWEMIFSIITDDSNSLEGGSFGLEIMDSNYPEIKMKIPRTEINQPNFGVLKRAILPADYKATLVTKFWNNGKSFNKKGWLELEVAYVKEDEVIGETPKVAIGKTRMHPGI